VLAEAGLVEVEKGYEGRRPPTWVRITRAGQRALTAEMASLSALLHRHETATARASPRRATDPNSPEAPAGDSVV
jgi:DNA-binding PadR family transcriptional regulator